MIHEVAASRGGLTASDRVAYTTLLLDRGARLDVRDYLSRAPRSDGHAVGDESKW